MKSVALYGGILVFAMAASWMRYTSDVAPAKEGVLLMDGKREDLEKVAYKGPEIEVMYEAREDATGKYGWLTVSDTKKKKKDGVETSETKVTRFKAGSAADKVLDGLAPMMALRPLEGVDDAKIESFGLKTPDTIITVTSRGKSSTFELGGETYGSKDRYVRDQATGRLYVVDDETFKPLKFANSRLPERGLTSPKVEEIQTISVGFGGTTVEWKQKNPDDKAAAYWERQQPPTAADATAKAGEKDESFENWIEKLLKVKSTAYVQEGEEPVEPELLFDLTVTASGKPPETVTFMKTADAWYARSNFTRGTVKLSKTAIEDLADEADDIVAGKTPPPKAPKSPRTPPPPPPAMAPSPAGGPPGGPPGAPPRPSMRPGTPGPVTPPG